MIYIVLFLAVFLDQITKYLAIIYLKNFPSVIIFKNWLDFTYVENTGVAFGSFKGYKYLFIILSISAFFAILIYIYKNKNKLTKLDQILYILIAAGAIGNCIDRIIHSFVVDFIHSPIGGIYDFPVFNIADIYISISCILLIIIAFLKKENKDEW